MKINKIWKKRNNFIFIFFLLLFSLRIFIMDRDLPDWGIMNYTPMDEGYYAMQAIQNTRAEDMELVRQLDGGKYPAWNSAVSYALTVFTTITIQLFGNSYWGLRMGSFFAAAIVFAIVLWIVYKEEGTQKSWPLFVTGSFLLFNFPFLLASKVTEPTIYRMMLNMVTIYVFWYSIKKEKAVYFWLGVWSMIAICCGYVTNIFVVFPCLAMVVTERILFQKSGWKELGQGLGGALGACGILEILMWITQGRTFLQDTFRILGSHIGTQRVVGIQGISGLYDNLRATMSGAIFSYCAVLLMASILALGICFYIGWKQKKRILLYLSYWMIGYGIMSLLTADFPLRKTIVILPVLVLMIYYACQQLDGAVLQKNSKIGMLWPIIVCVLGVISVYNVIKFLEKIHEQEMANEQKMIVLCLNIIAVVFLCLYLIWKKGQKFLGIVALVFTLAVNLYLDWNYVIHMEKTEVQIMKELNDLVGHDYVLGSGYAYAMYNDLIPASSGYDFYLGEITDVRARELLLEKDVDYFIGYYGDSFHGKWLENSEYHWEIVKRFQHSYEVSTQDTTDICLYKKVPNE